MVGLNEAAIWIGCSRNKWEKSARKGIWWQLSSFEEQITELTQLRIGRRRKKGKRLRLEPALTSQNGMPTKDTQTHNGCRRCCAPLTPFAHWILSLFLFLSFSLRQKHRKKRANKGWNEIRWTISLLDGANRLPAEQKKQKRCESESIAFVSRSAFTHHQMLTSDGHDSEYFD